MVVKLKERAKIYDIQCVVCGKYIASLNQRQTDYYFQQHLLTHKKEGVGEDAK